MPVTHKNRLVTTISNTPGGAGALTISTASSGYRTFAAGDDGKLFDVVIVDGTAWEVRTNCTYTNSGTSLSRGTLEDSSTGSAITLTSAAIVTVTASAGLGNFIEAMLQGITPGGRLTLESGVPVSTTDQTAKTSVYYTPYVHNQILLWDGSDWCPTTFTEKTLALGTLTSGKPYDVFGYLSSGALVLELLAWTNDSTRATAVTLQDGRYCKSGDKTRLYLGSFYTTSTTTTEDSAGGTTTQVGGKRFLWNMYNQVQRNAAVIDTTDSWSYTTNTIRQADAASGNKVEVMLGLAAQVEADIRATIYILSNTASAAKVGVGLDSTTAFSGLRAGAFNGPGNFGLYSAFGCSFSQQVAAGYHYLAWCESGPDGTGTFLGDNGADGQQSGMIMGLMS